MSVFIIVYVHSDSLFLVFFIRGKRAIGKLAKIVRKPLYERTEFFRCRGQREPSSYLQCNIPASASHPQKHSLFYASLDCGQGISNGELSRDGDSRSIVVENEAAQS